MEFIFKNFKGWPLGWRGSTAEVWFSPHTAPIVVIGRIQAELFRERIADKLGKKIGEIEIIAI